MAVTPDQVLKELSELWESLGKVGRAEPVPGVLRACCMTLGVLAETTEDHAALGETLATLMPEHPARSILVWLLGESKEELTARVTSQCWRPFGGRQQICSEHIEITASDHALKDLTPFALALAVPDLPLIVWCRSARLIDRAEFWELARAAQKIILDSAQLGEPEQALARVAHAVREGYLVGDLAWARLTRWRETLAQVFENHDYRALLPKVTSVRITHVPGRETSAIYLRAWLLRALKAAGARAGIEIAAANSPSVELSGEGLHVEQTAVEGPLVITVNGVSQSTNLPQPTDYLMVREELRILKRDPVFEDSLP